MNSQILAIIKIIFVYNALNDGWKLNILSNNKYEFTKAISEINADINNPIFIKEFINRNLNISPI